MMDYYDTNDDDLLDYDEQVTVWMDAIEGDGIFLLDTTLYNI